ncbi:MAG: hypothetical protein O2816_18065 [Planctomycetota bacterium]|nr:hypothetical protein [Planctomycetota bacterium]
MDARRLLLRMCTRHQLAYSDASRLLPLIERALTSPNHVRDRILVLVENNLARKATGNAARTTEQVHRDLDEEVLVSVTRVLHNWTPTSKVLDLGQVLPGLFPGDFDMSELED